MKVMLAAMLVMVSANVSAADPSATNPEKIAADKR